jgi:hypothetical protein
MIYFFVAHITISNQCEKKNMCIMLKRRKTVMDDDTFLITAEIRVHVLERLCTLLQEHYVFPNRVQQVKTSLCENVSNGTYDDVETADVFCEVVTEHLHALIPDKHLYLSYHPQPQPVSESSGLSDSSHQQLSREARLHNFGFYKVERLPGNIGYLDLRAFYPPDIAGDAIVAAMSFLAQTHALIIDLRRNGGGEMYMVHLLASYFVESEPIQLNGCYLRDSKELRQFWSFPYVPGQRYLNRPLYVLTGPLTASAAEEFAYDLQALKRATIVGESTAGAANPAESHQIDAHFTVSIPLAHTVNPVTGTSWEGTGVIPDIAVPAESALQMAHVEAVTRVLEQLSASSDEEYQSVLKEVQTLIKGLIALDD